MKICELKNINGAFLPVEREMTEAEAADFTMPEATAPVDAESRLAALEAAVLELILRG